MFPKGTEDVSDVFILSPWEALFLQNKTVIYLKENNHEETKNFKYIIPYYSTMREKCSYISPAVFKADDLKILFHGSISFSKGICFGDKTYYHSPPSGM